MQEEGVAPNPEAAGAAAAPPDEPNWRDMYLAGSPLYDEPSLLTIQDVPKLAQAWVDTKALVGRKGVIVPKDNAPPEEWERFYQDLGRPPSPDNYGIVRPESWPQEVPFEEGLVTEFKSWAHQAGLTNRQAKVIYDAYVQANLNLVQQQQEQLKAGQAQVQTELKTKWGGNYEANLAIARQACQKFAPAGSPAMTALDRAIGDDPGLIELFYHIGQAMGEAPLRTAGATPSATLESRRKELMASEAYINDNHMDHNKVVAEVQKIYQEMFPKLNT